MRTFSVNTMDGSAFTTEAENIEDIFGKIDGLRLMGKRWIKLYNPVFLVDVYVNIDQIVSIF